MVRVGLKAGARIGLIRGSSEAVLVSIAVTPSDPTEHLVDDDLQLTATGTYSDASEVDITEDVTWESSNEAVATVDADGLVTFVAAGTATITATLDAVEGETDLTIVNPLQSIAVTPDTTAVRLAAGTQQFTATGTYEDSSTADITATCTWTSGTPATATINASTGLATLVAAGTTLVTATLGLVSDNMTLTVTTPPTYQALGTMAVAAAGASLGPVGWPTHEAGDVALFIVTGMGVNNYTLSDAQGFVEITDSPQHSVELFSDARLQVFWCRATGNSMGSPTVADVASDDAKLGIIITFRGCKATGDPWDVTAGDSLGSTTGASTTVTIPGDTTTLLDTLVVAITADRLDSASTTRIGSWTNADLASLTERIDNGTTTGAGCGVGCATGVKGTAGAFGATTATLTSASTQARIAVALKSY